MRKLLLILLIGFIFSAPKLYYETPLENMDFETARVFLKEFLMEANMRVLGEEEASKKFAIFYACNLTYGEKILSKFPYFGTLAPCRVYLYEKNGKVFVGFINIDTLLKFFGEFMDKEAVETFKKAQRDLLKVVEELKKF